MSRIVGKAVEILYANGGPKSLESESAHRLDAKSILRLHMQ